MSVGSVGTIGLDLGINYGAFNNQLSGIANNAQNMVGGAFKGLAKIVGAAFAVKGLYDFSKEAIGLASSLSEVQNVVDTTFGSMTSEINDFSKTALEQFGLSELSAKKYSSTIGAMLKSSGITGKSLVEMSKGVTGLAGDMASFYNLDSQQAFDKIRAGLSGEVEPLKQLGINMSVANMEAYALSQGITKSYQAMSQAEQTMLRYNYLLSVSKDAQGDFAKTSGSWANQTRLLSEQFKIFQTTMGQGFINILTPVIGLINKLILKLQVAAEYFKAFTELIFGAQNPAASTAASVASMSDSTGDLAGAVKKAGKATKGSLGSFDQLNTLTKETAEAMDDMTGSMVVAGSMDSPIIGGAKAPEIDTSSLSSVKNVMSEISGIAKEVGVTLNSVFGAPFKQALDLVIPSLLGWKQSLFTVFSDLGSLWNPLKTSLLTSVLPAIQKAIPIFGDVLGGLLDSARKVFDGVWKAAKPIVEWFVTSGIPLFSEFAVAGMQIFQEWFDYLKTVFDTLWSGAVQPGLNLLSSMLLDILDSITSGWYEFGDNIVEGIITAIRGMKNTFNNFWTTFLKPFWDNLIKTVDWLWKNHLKGLVDEIVKFIGKLATNALEIYNKFILPVTNWLIKTLGPTFKQVFTTMTDIVGSLLGTVADVAKGIMKALGGVIDFITGVLTGNWKKAWQGLTDIATGMADSIEGVFRGVVNIVIDLINSLTRGLSESIKIEIPEWIPGVGGKKWNFSVPQIPKLANGGLVSAPTLAMVGDNRNARNDPEVVSPLSKLQSMLENSGNSETNQVLRLILQAIQNAPQPVIKIGETEFGRMVIKAINNIHRQSGETLLII